jgi:hypothetical protein
MRASYKAASRAVAAIFMLAETIGAQTLTVTPSTRDASGVFVTPVDNPVVSGATTLWYPQEAFRDDNFDTKTVGIKRAWGYYGFQLQMLTACASGDPDCGPGSITSDDAVLSPCPAENNRWTPGSGGLSMPIESRGLRIGHMPANVQIVNYNDSTCTASTVGTAQIQLAPDTIVVPLNVVVVRPAPSLSDLTAERERMIAWGGRQILQVASRRFLGDNYSIHARHVRWRSTQDTYAVLGVCPQ